MRRLPGARFHGVGPATAAKMQRLGIREGSGSADSSIRPATQRRHFTTANRCVLHRRSAVLSRSGMTACENSNDRPESPLIRSRCAARSLHVSSRDSGIGPARPCIGGEPARNTRRTSVSAARIASRVELRRWLIGAATRSRCHTGRTLASSDTNDSRDPASRTRPQQSWARSIPSISTRLASIHPIRQSRPHRPPRLFRSPLGARRRRPTSPPAPPDEAARSERSPTWPRSSPRRRRQCWSRSR